MSETKKVGKYGERASLWGVFIDAVLLVANSSCRKEVSALEVSENNIGNDVQRKV
jgi:hypothetical protein